MIDNLPKLLNISDKPDKVEILDMIVEIVTNQLLLYIDEPNLPIELEFIVVECSIKRFNLLNSEHLSSFSLEGLSNTFKDGDLLADYKEYLNMWISNNKDSKPESQQRKAKFI